MGLQGLLEDLRIPPELRNLLPHKCDLPRRLLPARLEPEVKTAPHPAPQQMLGFFQRDSGGFDKPAVPAGRNCEHDLAREESGPGAEEIGSLHEGSTAIGLACERVRAAGKRIASIWSREISRRLASAGPSTSPNTTLPESCVTPTTAAVNTPPSRSRIDSSRLPLRR